MTFEVGAVLDDSIIQAPSYCFTQDTDTNSKFLGSSLPKKF